MAEGEFALVRQHLEQALPKAAVPPGNAAPAGDHDLYALLADTCALQRDEAALRHYAPLAEEAAARYGHQLYLGIAHRAWGVAHCLAGEYAESEARLQEALKIFETLDTRWQWGRALFELGQLARAQNHTAEARDCFTHALAAFEELHAAPDANRTRAVLESLG
jgi:tetratricopeptide (TPR) repeat protein